MGDHSKKEKKDKKEKKEKRSETTDAGVKKAKKAKKEKKERKRESLAAVSDALETALERRSATPERELPVDGDGDVDMNEGGDEQEEQGGSGSTKIAASALVTEEALNAALVPFAHPLIVEEKDVKKVLKGVKKCKIYIPPPQKKIPSSPFPAFLITTCSFPISYLQTPSFSIANY